MKLRNSIARALMPGALAAMIALAFSATARAQYTYPRRSR